MNIFKRIKAQFVIPRGIYCYKLLRADIPNGKLYTKVCPFWEKLPRNDAKCHLLHVDGDICLWDQVKICGIKERLPD